MHKDLVKQARCDIVKPSSSEIRILERIKVGADHGF